MTTDGEDWLRGLIKRETPEERKALEKALFGDAADPDADPKRPPTNAEINAHIHAVASRKSPGQIALERRLGLSRPYPRDPS